MHTFCGSIWTIRPSPWPSCLTALTELGDDPFADGPDVKKPAGNDDLYRLSVGDFRVIHQVRGDVLVILVVHVGNRRDVHRGL
ncbi:type II toxin-antitoxin system RelE/ParE family toxin [Kitasatospora sp. NPDC127067]|uniref:type II toxin-antitoxin system RelE family toxin n=1 Tax=Kitasatospora sp. NPDC127067 TaxID=3347126 RepID=UPI00365F5E3A